jgi:hypothetical protein
MPDDVARLGYDLKPEGEGQRILAAGILERFTRNKDGTLAPLTPGSTAPVAETRAHAGIVKVERYHFDMT